MMPALHMTYGVCPQEPVRQESVLVQSAAAVCRARKLTKRWLRCRRRRRPSRALIWVLSPRRKYGHWQAGRDPFRSLNRTWRMHGRQRQRRRRCGRRQTQLGPLPWLRRPLGRPWENDRGRRVQSGRGLQCGRQHRLRPGRRWRRPGRPGGAGGIDCDAGGSVRKHIGAADEVGLVVAEVPAGRDCDVGIG